MSESIYVGRAHEAEERHRRAESALYDLERIQADVWPSDRIKGFWVDELRARVRRDKDAVVLVWGEPGSGKSTCVMDMARRVDPTFTPDTLSDRAAFKPRDVPRIYQTTPQYGAAWIDEAVSSGLLATDTLSGDQKDLVELINVIRAKNVVLFVVVPDPGDLAKSFRARRADYRIECQPLVEGSPAAAFVGRRVRQRKFNLDDGKWLGFRDDPTANPITWNEYRTSSVPIERALWDAYRPLKYGFLDDKATEIGDRMDTRAARRTKKGED